ncbi:MAG: DNA polymerase III subunit gamma/tau [Acidobacteria bacterium]|nr:MAG: DNA polymerase III subunit gamma/tau [Acidobacteriota bacterium]REK01844.1 MAG: DNA polymerase III subunit gamma/tau [Acidobacteriota bacterium]REK14800.1 MAG: DNA polymerase III subunit gamma/tau [Acidobacteriota bacterium]REK45515.1 MAG: DNA polymerase III subunit gamma/tau [Acidobacteriota bacterium]
MTYQVLARKWRPQVFEEVVGQEAITRTLRNGIESGRLHHAYLFSGARGVGKTTTARLLAKALNCHKSDGPNPVPCVVNSGDACESCKEIAESRSMDVLEFDAASHTKVEEIREIILESININPARDRNRVFIIDEVHMLSKSSFNALLKTLEEPPENVVFVMATTELHKVPDTITSRCQEFEFRTIPLKKILDRLTKIADAENIEISEDALKEIARSGEGSMRDAQSNFDQVISFSGEKITAQEVSEALGIAGIENLISAMSSIAEQDSEGLLKVVDDLVVRGHDLRNFCRDLMGFVRDLLVFKIAGDAHGLLDTAILPAEEMRSHAAPFLEADLIRFFNSLAATEASLRDAAEPRFVLEIGLVKLSEMRRVAPIEELLKRFEELTKSSDPTETPTAEAAAAAPEKKTSESDRSVLESAAPADTGGMPAVQPSEAGKNQARPESEPDQYDDHSGLEANPFDGEPDFEPDSGRDPSPSIDPVSMPVKLPPISSEDLEHVEDSWLDDAYERVLEREGDDCMPLPGARFLVEALVGNVSESTVSENDPNSNGSGSETNRAIEIVEEMAKEEESNGRIPDLPDDPTREDLLKYATAHPTIKKALKLFRGEIVDVRKE